MKLGDKLIQLRKRKGLSQEELAEKLGVSRQSVSKWESNNTYPETERLIQICNIFECSMDDLINDKVVDIDKTLRSSKNNYKEAIDSLLDFITKSINMFSSMSFLSGIKCVIEIGILILILWFLGFVFSNILASIFAGIFSALGNNVTHGVQIFSCSIFYIICFIIGFIVVVHTFKIRYLDYYDKTNSSNVEIEEEKVSNNKMDKKVETKVIIRDEKDKPFAFLGFFSKIVICFIKFIVLCIAIGVIFTIIFFVVTNVFLISLIKYNILFLFLSLSNLCVVVITTQFLILLLYFILSRKVNVNLHIIVFIVSLLLFSIFTGLSILSLKSFEVIDDNINSLNLTKESVLIDYSDNLVIDGCYSRVKYRFISDNTLDNKIKVEKAIDKNFSNIVLYNHDKYGMRQANVCYNFNGNLKYLYKIITDDLKNNKIRFNYDYDTSYEITIYASDDIIDKLIDNIKKIYLVSVSENDGVILVEVLDNRIETDQYANYNVIQDTVKVVDDDYSCNKLVKNSDNGEKIVIDCEYNDE